jgi:acetyl esterase/lipase
MRVDPIKIALSFLIMFIGCAGKPTIAGPLRDRIMQHRQAQQRDDMLDISDSSDGSAALPPGTRVIKDFPFGPDKRQSMDVYMPPHAVSAPVLMMVHGGGWRRGDKAMRSVIENKIKRWVPKGFVFISINYRMLPDSDPLQQAGDVIRALAIAQSNAATWGGDASKFILMGHSAGAHLVSLVAANSSKAIKLGARPWLGTVSLDSAALDVVEIMQRKHFRLYDPAFGSDVSYWKSASPVHQLTPAARPILAVCSSTRPDKPCSQAHHFADAASSLGVRASVSEQAMTHREINQDLGLPGKYTDAVERFMGSLDESVKTALSNDASSR